MKLSKKSCFYVYIYTFLTKKLTYIRIYINIYIYMKKNKKMYSFYIVEDSHLKLKKISTRFSESVASLINVAINEYLERRKVELEECEKEFIVSMPKTAKEIEDERNSFSD